MIKAPRRLQYITKHSSSGGVDLGEGTPCFDHGGG